MKEIKMSERIKEAAEKYVTKGGKYALDILDEDYVKQSKAIFTAGANFMLEELLKEPDTILGLSSRIVKLQRKIAKLTEALKASDKVLTLIKRLQSDGYISFCGFSHNESFILSNLELASAALKSCEQCDEQTLDNL